MIERRNMYHCNKCKHRHHYDSKIGKKHFGFNSKKEIRLLPSCIICGSDLSAHCTENVCEECCKNMKCPIRYKCNAYPKVLEKIIKKKGD